MVCVEVLEFVIVVTVMSAWLGQLKLLFTVCMNSKVNRGFPAK